MNSDKTYFNKVKKINIEDLDIGSVVYLKVKSPLNYGVWAWEYYGKIVKVTNCYFEILEYADASFINYWYTDSILKHEENPKEYTKKWAKKSIIELYVVNFEKKKDNEENKQ